MSHLLASAKACDAIMAVRIRRRRRASCASCIHCAQFVQSHALSFFHLSAPDLLLGMDSDPARRNVFGLIEEQPGPGARRHRAAQVRPAGHRRAGAGARASLVDRARRRQRAARRRQCATASWPDCPPPRRIAERTLAFFKTVLDQFAEEIANFGSAPTMYAGLVDADGGLQLYDGLLRFRDAEGSIVADRHPRRATTRTSSARPRCAIPI